MKVVKYHGYEIESRMYNGKHFYTIWKNRNGKREFNKCFSVRDVIELIEIWDKH